MSEQVLSVSKASRSTLEALLVNRGMEDDITIDAILGQLSKIKLQMTQSLNGKKMASLARSIQAMEQGLERLARGGGGGGGGGQAKPGKFDSRDEQVKAQPECLDGIGESGEFQRTWRQFAEAVIEQTKPVRGHKRNTIVQDCQEVG